MDEKWNAYIELTNMGTENVDMGQFGIQSVPNWNDGGFDYYSNNMGLRFPSSTLAPGESYVVSNNFNFLAYLAKLKPQEWYPYTKPEMLELADFIIECKESELAATEDVSHDTVSPLGYDALWSFNGGGHYFLKWYSSDGSDSAVVDAVDCVFEDGNGKPIQNLYEVAGIPDAKHTHVLIRKANVTTGNLEWDNSRGTDIVDSEWLPVPTPWGSEVNQDYDRDPYWTVGNHGDYNLDENTLESVNPDVTVDWLNKTISVPWGMRKHDTIMHQFKRKPGVAWLYKWSPEREDSAFNSIQNGDSLTIYVTGNDLDMAQFAFIVNEPTDDATTLVPTNTIDDDGYYDGIRGYPFDVINGDAMDTITEVNFQTRVDTLLKYLEKAPDATWEVKKLNNEERADLKDGDILTVTAADGTTARDYYIEVYGKQKNTNAFLGSITWPDIPQFYIDAYGWTGDTIPNFSSTNTNYNLLIPYDFEGVPALVAKPENPNTNVDIQRAKSLRGSEEDRTITITTTAEDDTTIVVYKVIITQEKDPAEIQPWEAEPLLTQFGNREQGLGGHWNSAWEIANPGTEVIDMSNYIFIKSTTPADAITDNKSWDNRHLSYIPGMQWVDSATWVVTPGLFEDDIRVNTQTFGGDVFVMASAGGHEDFDGYHWAEDRFDVNFRNKDNPWNVGSTLNGTAIDFGWGSNSSFYLFRIDNDSITRGLKPANDPQDFTLIDMFGTGIAGEKWNYMNDVSGETDANGHKRVHFRKPHIYEGNPVPGAMFSMTSADSSEWRSYFSPDDIYPFTPDGSYYWATRYVVGWDLGTHTFDEVTIYQSIISSTSYIVSTGFSTEESIRGVVSGTTVDQFLDNIIKKDEEQVLTVKNAAGDVITTDTDMDNGSTLEVVSADGTNSTIYTVEIGALSDDAVLTSSEYTVNIETISGTIEDIPMGTSVATVLENIVKPGGSVLTVIDEEGKYVPSQKLNFDTTYVDVMATQNVFFEVIAEDGQATILYQLVPVTTSSDAFVYSDIYEIDQETFLINFVPGNTTANNLLAELTPSSGASMKVLDKEGTERTEGTLYIDDIVVVTSEDETTENVYHLGLIGPNYNTNSLSYVVSDVYMVDQQELSITATGEILTTETTLTEFYDNLTVAPGATMVVMNSNDEENTTGDLDDGDYLMVTAADGVTVTYYSLTLEPVSVNYNNVKITVYPNPTTDIVYISGVEIGYKVRVYNSLGKLISTVNVMSDRQAINLGSEQAGFYYLNVEDAGKKVGSYKLLKTK